MAGADESPLLGELYEALRNAVEIIDKHVHIDALGSNWEGNDEVPGGVRSWPIKEEYLHYMRETLAKVQRNRAASVDARPTDGDSTQIEAPLASSAVAEGETPNA